MVVLFWQMRVYASLVGPCNHQPPFFVSLTQLYLAFDCNLPSTAIISNHTSKTATYKLFIFVEHFGLHSKFCSGAIELFVMEVTSIASGVQVGMKRR
jgi:hypothetical protein